MSPGRISMASTGLATNASRPASLGHLSTSARCSVADEGGATASTASAQGDVSSRISINLREQPVAGGEIDDPAAAKQPAHTARGLPGFIQLLAWKTSGMTDGPADTIESVSPGKRARSRSVRRPRDEREKRTSKDSASVSDGQERSSINIIVRSEHRTRGAGRWLPGNHAQRRRPLAQPPWPPTWPRSLRKNGR